MGPIWFAPCTTCSATRRLSAAMVRLAWSLVTMSLSPPITSAGTRRLARAPVASQRNIARSPRAITPGGLRVDSKLAWSSWVRVAYLPKPSLCDRWAEPLR